MKGLSARYEKTVAQNNPIFARRKTNLKRGFTPKKAYDYKAPSWLVFQTARVGSRRAFFPARQLRSIQLRGAISLCALPPAREYAILKTNVRQKDAR